MCIAALGGAAGAIGAIASIAGTVVSVMGQMQAAESQAKMSEYQAKQSRIVAEDALKRGVAEEQAQRRKTAALESRQRAVLAASNVDIGSGSPLQILSDTAMLGELDAQTIRNNSEREAAQHRAQAGLYDMQAGAARQAGMINAFGTALGGISSLADRWYRPMATTAATRRV